MPEDVFQPTSGLFVTDKMVRDWLRKPFKPEQVGKIPASKGRPALDFVGHAAVTDRLNRIAPDWTYTVEELFKVGESVWIRGTMTIGGVSRPEYGDGDDPKEAIGNFIRRGAMRFGVAIDLWSREELEESSASESPAGLGSQPSGTESAAELPGPAAANPGEVALSPSPGSTSPAEGYGEGSSAGAGRPGEAAETDSSPGHRFTEKASTCSHKTPTGEWVATITVKGQDRCSRCGTPAVKYREAA